MEFIEQERWWRRSARRTAASPGIAATLRGALAETGERVGGGLTTPPPQASRIKVSSGAGWRGPGLSAGRALSPALSDPQAPDETFAEGEALEFLQAQPRRAAEWYHGLAASPVPAVRAGALLRLGRVLRKLGRQDESRAVYTQLAGFAGGRVAGAPA
jgi:hypothetical protein